MSVNTGEYNVIELEELKEEVCAQVEARASELIDLGRDIAAHPELGFKEQRTAGLVKDYFEALSLPYRDELALTGVCGELNGRSKQATIALMGELDAVICAAHPQADPSTGAAHACGHNAQVVSMLGAAAGLVSAGASDYLDGTVRLMAVPAEEYVELEYRQGLKDQGAIEFFGGKQEFIRLGEFEDVDAAMMIHLSHEFITGQVSIGGTSNGFLGKLVRFQGQRAHAGGAPHKGVNALNAAMVAMVAIHAQRETFRDQDHIRVHPILTRGGDLVNIVPADVRMETYVRGRSIEAIQEANGKVNRALRAGGMATGAGVEIIEVPGYLPRRTSAELADLFAANGERVLGPGQVKPGEHGSGSTDFGDVSHLLPGIHPMVGAVRGNAHAESFEITNERLAYVEPAKIMALTVIDLLADGAHGLKRVKKNFEPVFDRQSYLDMWRSVVAECQ